MPVLTQIAGALCAGALLLIVARHLALGSQRVFGAIALVAISVATVLAIPTLREDVTKLLAQRKEYVGWSKAEGEAGQAIKYGINFRFLEWVEGQLGEGETFDLEIGAVPGEPTFEGGGVFEGSVYAWAIFQLGPHLLVENAPKADWIVFYGIDPKEYPGKLGKVIYYEGQPDYAIARTPDAG